MSSHVECFFNTLCFFCAVFRQCLCCFKEYKHLEVFNQLVYALINLVIAQISSLRDRLCSVQDHTHKGGVSGTEGVGSEWGGGEPAPGALPQPSSPGEDEPVNVERDSAEEDGDAPDLNQNKTQSQGQGPNQPCEAQMEALGPGESASGSGGGDGDGVGVGANSSSDSQDPFSSWSTEEREKLLLCAAKIFQIQFPLYTAYKHNTHPTIEVRTSPVLYTTHRFEQLLSLILILISVTPGKPPHRPRKVFQHVISPVKTFMFLHFSNKNK